MIQRKRIYAFIIASLLLAGSSYAQTTKTFYVSSGSNFTLTPQLTTFSNYQWNDIANLTTPLALVANLVRTAPVISNATYSVKRYQLMVKDSATGCWSNPDTFTVFTLPPILANVLSPDSIFCSLNSTLDTLKAQISTLSLPPGVAADLFSWTLNNNPIGTNSSSLPIVTGSTPGTSVYGVSVSYTLPAVIGGSKLSATVGVGAVTIKVNNAPTVPIISIL